MTSILKCRKCRQSVVNQDSTTILNNHNTPLNDVNNSINFDCTGNIVDVWYLLETEAPEWVLNNINEANWRKGKLTCPSCRARIGSFDFISGAKCPCKEHVLPPIHLVKSKIDLCK